MSRTAAGRPRFSWLRPAVRRLPCMQVKTGISTQSYGNFGLARADLAALGLPGASVAPEVALELAGDRVAARLWQVHRVLGLFQSPHVVGDLGVLLGELVHAALPGACLLGQVGQR